nr:hypothetical protein [Paenibacillus bovis]
MGGGVGSSGCGIIGGIEVGNEVWCLSLRKGDKLKLGTEMEGDGDNVGGGL